MGKFGDALKAGLHAAREGYVESRNQPAGARFVAAGAVVRCAHCGGDRFASREAIIQANAMPLLNAPWLDRSATVLICVQCAELRWFGIAPTAAS